MDNFDLQQYFNEQCSVQDNVIRLGQAQLPREEFAWIKKLLQARGGKWKGGKTFGFVFESDATEIYKSLCNGDFQNKKNHYQFFPTPESIANRMVDLLFRDVEERISPLAHILEPSAGRGALCEAVHRWYPNVIIDAYEINPDCLQTLRELWNLSVHDQDFLTISPYPCYDFIIANPPFAKNADIDYFRQMYQVLIPGGRMVCILSSHALEATRERKVSEFKEWLYSLHPDTVEELPAGTFKSAGTDVRTYLVALTK